MRLTCNSIPALLSDLERRSTLLGLIFLICTTVVIFPSRGCCEGYMEAVCVERGGLWIHQALLREPPYGFPLPANAPAYHGP